MLDPKDFQYPDNRPDYTGDFEEKVSPLVDNPQDLLSIQRSAACRFCEPPRKTDDPFCNKEVMHLYTDRASWVCTREKGHDGPCIACARDSNPTMHDLGGLGFFPLTSPLAALKQKDELLF